MDNPYAIYFYFGTGDSYPNRNFKINYISTDYWVEITKEELLFLKLKYDVIYRDIDNINYVVFPVQCKIDILNILNTELRPIDNNEDK